MENFTPREIVSELDKYIVGQKDAKRAVAIALRNRWRRQQVQSELREEIMPNNIIMIGPTGVGRTEIARRLAGLANAPFLKVEASKFTEVGYVGRDVESMIRDLMDIAVSRVKAEAAQTVQPLAEAPRISISLTGQKVKLAWTGGGKLESAPESTGPWTEVPGAVSGVEIPVEGNRQFYRVRQ